MLCRIKNMSFSAPHKLRYIGTQQQWHNAGIIHTRCLFIWQHLCSSYRQLHQQHRSCPQHTQRRSGGFALWIFYVTAVLLAVGSIACSGDNTASDFGFVNSISSSTDAVSGSSNSNGADPNSASSNGSAYDELDMVRVRLGEAIQVRTIFALGGDIGKASHDYLNAVELALEEYGLIRGNFTVELGTPLDEQCSYDGGERAARSVLADTAVVGVIGTSCSTAAMAAAPLLGGAGLTMISPSNSAASLTSDLVGTPGVNHHAGYFRVADNDLHKARAIAEFMRFSLESRYAVTVHNGDTYTRDLTDAFSDAFESLGGVVIATSYLDHDHTDADILQALKKLSDTDVVFSPLLENLGLRVISQIRKTDALNDADLVWAVDELSDETLSVQATTGIYIATFDHRYSGNVNEATGAEYDKVHQRLTHQAGYQPQKKHWAHAYDATTMLLDAIDSSSHMDGNALVINRAAIRKNLATVSAFQSLTGLLSCDSYGDCGDTSIAITHHTDPANPAAARTNIVYTYTP